MKNGNTFFLFGGIKHLTNVFGNRLKDSAFFGGGLVAIGIDYHNFVGWLVSWYFSIRINFIGCDKIFSLPFLHHFSLPKRQMYFG